MNNVVLHKNMPVIAGNLKWSQELRERILSQRNQFRHINHQSLQTKEANLVFQKCDKMLALIDNYDQQIYSLWIESLDAVCQANLNQPFLKWNEESGLYSMNFNPELSSVLREVKYLGLLKGFNIADVALHLYSKRAILDMCVENWKLITDIYNKLYASILEVEFPLVEHELKKINEQLRPATETLTWQTEDSWEYIQQTRQLMQDLNSRMQKIKCNVETIHSIVQDWSHALFILHNKYDSATLFLDKEEKMMKYYKFIQDGGESIHQLVEDNLHLFYADDQADEWKVYAEYIDHIILDGFYMTIKSFLQYLNECTETLPKSPPQFEVQLVLHGCELSFNPPLDLEKRNNFCDLIEESINAVYKMGSKVKRVAKHLGIDTYQQEIDTMSDLAVMRQEIMNKVRRAVDKAIKYQASFDKYSYLWMNDRKEFMRQFLLYGRSLFSEELEVQADCGLPKCPPQLEQFREQINIYETLYVQISAFEDVHTFGWFQVSIKPLKLSLLNIIKRWSWIFKEHLLNHVITSVNQLLSFITITEEGIAKKVQDGDYAGLVQIMAHLMAIRDRKSAANDTFESLKETAELLKTCGQQLSEHIYTGLATSIDDWTKTQWKQINVEQMDMELRRFAKVMKTLDKEVRLWDVFAGLASMVKNMLTSLRAVTELQNPAVRMRHWQELMNATGVGFVMDADTTLGVLLALQLYRVEEEVKNIVDKAVKEMAIEKVQLQNILMSKYVEYFFVGVCSWQKKLMVTDLVISMWMEVQKTWAYLQNIFTGSEDIRNQLSEDAKRFDEIDLNFKELMAMIVKTNKVIETTNNLGLLEKLEVLQQRLTHCEKALAEYLETKRLSFSRFYFVSAMDLLEIISKGDQPKQVNIPECSHCKFGELMIVQNESLETKKMAYVG
ncbi:hypothetical protein chiPu_0005635 [Chiloscyllium punctatum]|uniref:Dynein heavy chain linker domain-containing protein n=1 Tax=Chiloscyllium punctatum TaxID=137246 RepID=A0A401SA27_CHIPU|nr:hypothetical protein [Chiloscyllium punctatum]